MKRLPSFLVIGAQKAGTTTLHDWLRQQPDVCLPSIKETHFFNLDERYHLGIDWYLRQFPECGNGAVVGEISPAYLFFEAVPLRIKKDIDSPKFIIIFRDPIDRAWSHYLMSLGRGHETLPFIEALLAEEDRLSVSDNRFALFHHSYVARGKYCEQVKRYKRVFPASEFLYIKFNDLFSEKEGFETYKKICSFIDIKSAPEIADRNKKSNQASTSRSLFLRDFLYKSSWRSVRRTMGGLLGHSIRIKIKRGIEKLNLTPLRKDDFKKPADIPEPILNTLRNEILELEDITRLDLHDWMT